MGVLFLLVVLLLLAGIILVAAAMQGDSARGREEDPGFEPCRELFSPAERSFFGVLEQAASEFKVLGKVRLGDLIRPEKGGSQGRRSGSRSALQQRHVDFVLCRSDTLAVAAVVELDDPMRRHRKGAAGDDFVEKALASAYIPLLYFSARKGYGVAEVRKRLAAAVGLPGAASVAPKGSPKVKEVKEVKEVKAPPPERGSASLQSKTAGKVAPAVDRPPAAPPKARVCPVCRSAMVKRRAQKGKYAGQWFWVCSTYPKCRQVMAVRGKSAGAENGGGRIYSVAP